MHGFPPKALGGFWSGGNISKNWIDRNFIVSQTLVLKGESMESNEELKGDIEEEFLSCAV